MRSTMIVVANSVHARIFTTDSAKSPWVEVETMAHPEGRLHDRDLTSDLPGKNRATVGSAGHAYQDKTDPKGHERSDFAKRVAAHIDEALKDNQSSDLIVIAEPAFLGELRAHYSAATKERVALELDKNLTQHSSAEIRQHLPEYLTH